MHLLRRYLQARWLNPSPSPHSFPNRSLSSQFNLNPLNRRWSLKNLLGGQNLEVRHPVRLFLSNRRNLQECRLLLSNSRPPLQFQPGLWNRKVPLPNEPCSANWINLLRRRQSLWNHLLPPPSLRSPPGQRQLPFQKFHLPGPSQPPRNLPHRLSPPERLPVPAIQTRDGRSYIS